MKRYLILGHKGFLGKYIRDNIHKIEILNREECSILKGIDIPEFDLTKFYELPSDNEKFDVIFHCASNKDILTNYLIDANVIWWWQNFQKNAVFVTFGSDSCYSETNYPNSEIFYAKGEPYSRWELYAKEKIALYNMLNSTNGKWYHFVLTSLFGEGFKLEDEHLVHSLIKKIVNAKHNKSICKVGQSNFIREVVYAQDLVKNIKKCIEFDELSRRPINLGSGKKQAYIKEIVKQICFRVNFPLNKVKFDNTESGHSFKCMDNSKISNFLGKDFEDSSWDCLESVIEYYKNSIKK